MLEALLGALLEALLDALLGAFHLAFAASAAFSEFFFRNSVLLLRSFSNRRLIKPVSVASNFDRIPGHTARSSSTATPIVRASRSGSLGSGPLIHE